MFALVRSQAGGELREVGLGKEEQAGKQKNKKQKQTWDFRGKHTAKEPREAPCLNRVTSIAIVLKSQKEP